MLVVRKPESIYQIRGRISHGTFSGRWHFSFDQYHDPEYLHWGTLRVFNDDTLSPGAVWPLHPHKNIEVVTYCAQGEFRHEDEHGTGGVLKKGWVQHTSVGRGMWHSEINQRQDIPMRFIQMWFIPSVHDLNPSVEQKAVEKIERTNQFLPLVSNEHPGALPIYSPAEVYSSFLQAGKRLEPALKEGWGAYLYVLEGGPVLINHSLIPLLGAAKVTGETGLEMEAEGDTELLLVKVLLD